MKSQPKSTSGWIASHRGAGALLSLVLVAMVLAPIAQNARDRPVDSFPLSYYPMFSHERGETYRTSYLVGLDADGNRTKISYRYAGAGGLNQTRRQLRKIIEQDRAPEICTQVAERVGQSRRRSLQGVERIQVVQGRYHIDRYFLERDKAPAKEWVYATCAVPVRAS